jgi:hypothetical protein
MAFGFSNFEVEMSRESQVIVVSDSPVKQGVEAARTSEPFEMVKGPSNLERPEIRNFWVQHVHPGGIR